MMIDEYADLKCSSCNHEENIYCWSFDCSNHPASEQWKLPNLGTLMAMLAFSTDYYNTQGQEWLRSLITHANETAR